MSAAPPPPSRPGKKEVQVVRALYNYTAQNPDELSFEEGTVIYVLSKSDANWWKCKIGDKEGFVPSNYVGENTAVIDNPLHEAAKRGNVPFVKELIAAGVSVNSLDKAGNAPIHWASRGGHAEVVRLLLEKNAAVNSPNKLGDTPLHLAAWGGNPEVVQILLSQPGVRIDLRNKEKQTPLDIARNDECASLLVNFAGANSAADLAGADEDED